MIRISTQGAAWAEAEAVAGGAADVTLAAPVARGWLGFGGCFNELGWEALGHLEPGARAGVLDELFGDDGLALNYNRVPIGANDYSTSWYSHNELGHGHNDPDTDFAMERFSIHRDHKALIPYMREAMARRGDMSLFASPWCPPTWLKAPRANNYGRLVWEEPYRKAYALYFLKFVQAYRALGLPVRAVHVQNEPDSDQKFPSCLWDGQRLRDFIRDDLAPCFRAAGLDCEIWLGTIERGSFNDWIAPTLLDAQARAAITGLGFQWAGKHAVQRTAQAAPEKVLIQTENECGDGQNSWDYAHYVFDLMQHYLANGARAYVYWNMVLPLGGVSTWGWRQNSLYCVDVATGALIRNPEYWLMRHVAGVVRPGADVLRAEGRWASNTLAFRNADGSEVAVLQNPLGEGQEVGVALGGQVRRVVLPPHSFATLTSATV